MVVRAEAKVDTVTVGGGGGGGRGGGDGGGYEKTEATKDCQQCESLGSLMTTRLEATIRRCWRRGGEAGVGEAVGEAAASDRAHCPPPMFLERCPDSFTLSIRTRHD